MTQSIVIQGMSITYNYSLIKVGQCGNQIGNRFWTLAIDELRYVNKKELYDSSVSSFFINGADEGGAFLPKLSGLKARSVLVDMEEGVVAELFKGPLKNIYDNRFLITDVSGSGNNWAVGNLHYGNLYLEDLTDAIRKSAELCDYLQCFFILHSMGGGTGSGIGTRILKILYDEFPNVYRMDTAVFPSMDDDVITSPYNTVLALQQLTDLADCVMPIDNLALANIVTKSKETSRSTISKDQRAVDTCSGNKTDSTSKRAKPFDEMNNLVANMLLNLTSSSRFEGTMNVDLNEISMNLVPFPRLHYLITAQSPLALLPSNMAPRKLDQAFSDAFARDFQLVSADPCRSAYLAAALLVRGGVNTSDLRRNIERLQTRLKFVPWNREGWKVGHCSVPPVGLPYSLLAVSNNTVIRECFGIILERFNKLFRRKAHLHHYTTVEGFEMSMFKESVDSLEDLQSEYMVFENQAERQKLPEFPRLRIKD